MKLGLFRSLGLGLYLVIYSKVDKLIIPTKLITFPAKATFKSLSL
jgi:hypothetical protein